MNLIIFFFSYVIALCSTDKIYFRCVDESGLFLCLRAQDQVNTLIQKINDSSVPLMELNCTKFIVSDSSSFERMQYSKKNNDACLTAQNLFDSLVEKHSLTKLLPIECENIDDPQNYSSTLKLHYLIYTIVSIAFLL